MCWLPNKIFNCSRRYREDVLSLTIFMIGLFAMLAVVLSFLETTVLVFSPILQATSPASTVMVWCRGSSPISASNATAGADFKAQVIPLRISPLSLSKLSIAVFCLILLHQTTDAYVSLGRRIAVKIHSSVSRPQLLLITLLQSQRVAINLLHLFSK